MISTSLIVFFLFGYIPHVTSNEICVRGFLMDTYCIIRGTLLDNPSVRTLVHPELHSAHCLLDIPECLESYEILKPPDNSSATYSRWYMLDKPNGLKMAINYGRKMGKNCAGCTGNIVVGIMATVRGHLLDTNVTPPVINVTSIDNADCPTPSMPIPRPVLMPASAPSPISPSRPIPHPVSMPASAPSPVSPSMPIPLPASAPSPVFRNSSVPVNNITCFSAMNTVEVKDVGHIHINKLKIGDHVRVGNGQFSQVYGFGHLAHNQDAEFLQIQFYNYYYDAADRFTVLEVSATHLLFVTSNQVLPASDIKVGDAINNKVVLSIRRIIRRGVYAPLTQSGDIVVSGIPASNYVKMIDRDYVWDHHYLGHTYFYPHRLFCRYFLKECTKETYVNGFSYWAYYMVHFAKCLTKYGEFVLRIVWYASVPLMGMVYAMESMSNLFRIAVGFLCRCHM